MEEDDYWNRLSDGLAVFIGPNLFESFELPISFNPFVYVGQEFYLRPMLPMFTGDGRFFLLALSQNQVRFFEGSRHSITPVIINDVVPENMEEALVFEDGEAVLVGRSDVPNYGSVRYHGHGQGKDDWENQIHKYFREVDDGLMSFLHDENAPMIIAAVDHLVPIYRELSNYSNIMDVHIKGNPEQESPVLLHEKAWYKMAPYFKAQQQEAYNEFEEKRSYDKASASIEDIVPAAINGRVETVFIDKDAVNLWGFYDIASNEIALQEGRKGYSTCLLNAAAIHTFLQSGKVYNVPAEEMPDANSPINAIFRY